MTAEGAPANGVDVSVVVVSYNTCDLTAACVRSALSASTTRTVEVVVVDNASRDSTVETLLALEEDRLVVDPAGRNLGFARAVNRGVAASSGRFVLLLNPDAELHPGALDALVDHAEAHPEHGLYGGRALHGDGSVDPTTCWGAITPWSLLCFATGLSTAFAGSSVLDPESLGRWPRDTIREVPVITGCLLLATRSVWDELGGLDPVYFLYGEDTAFSTRAWRSGHRPVVVPRALITHVGGASTGGGSRKMPLVLAGKVTFVRTMWPGWRRGVGVRLLVAGVGLRAAAERATGRRDGMWSSAWTSRATWSAGYPEAERQLVPA